MPKIKKHKRFNLYRFLPIQLFLLHFRKYQLLLCFWFVLFATITGHFASTFGAASLFLSPEYLDEISLLSFMILGGATAIFIVSWNITTFIIHSTKIPFLGATRQAFVKYSWNNSILPFIFLILYSVHTVRFLKINEGYDTLSVLLMLAGFYAGLIFILLISFLYFFGVNRNILKTVLGSIGQLTAVANIIPYDSLDDDEQLVNADTYLNGFFKIDKIQKPYQYNLRFLNVVLRRHHRNAAFSVTIAYVVLLLLGIFMDNPIFRLPAGAGFLLLFAVILALVGVFKLLLKSWEVIGWAVFFLILNFFVLHGVFDLRSYADGISYRGAIPEYNYSSLQTAFHPDSIKKDYNIELNRLENWKNKFNGTKPTIVLISVSGGGSRSAYWVFRNLQYADSLSGGKLFQHTVLITGASGGMIGGSYWQSVHNMAQRDNNLPKYDMAFQENIGKDLLNPIVFSMATRDYISPFNKIIKNGERYGKDRGNAFENELKLNTNGFLNKKLNQDNDLLLKGKSPLLIVNSTIINDGRKLLIAPMPVSYLTTAELKDNRSTILYDAVDFNRFFKSLSSEHLELTSALRMGATFPLILPVVKLPSFPEIEVMDAGLRDNHGMETSVRYLSQFSDWMIQNCRSVILLQINDTKTMVTEDKDTRLSLDKMLIDPVFTIQRKWNSFQNFKNTYLMEGLENIFPDEQFYKIKLEFAPENKDHAVGLNFHLTSKDKKELRKAIFNKDNKEAIDKLIDLLEE